MVMSIEEFEVHADRQQWQNKASLSDDPNVLFFSWYDELRKKHFGMDAKNGLTLEIGPGEGGFTRACNPDVVIDVSKHTLLSLRREGGPICVVADAAHLPFHEGSFFTVYTNDVAHHLKAQGLLPQAAQEVRRILSLGGFWCVSDRRPSLLNTVTLALSALGRSLHIGLCGIFNKCVNYSGGEDEPAMTLADFEVICQGLNVESRIGWRNAAIFWVYGLFQFVRLALPQRMAHALALHLLRLLDVLERHMPQLCTTDVCLKLRKSTTS